MTRLWLVRHGPTHATGMIGWTDLPADLSDGAALSRLSDHLPDAPVLTSDLSRAVATADALPGRPRLGADPGLREIHFGRWEGRRFAEVEAEEPEALAAFWQQPGPSRATEGECWAEMRTRVQAAVEARLGPPDLIVVCHFGPILACLERALGVPTTEVFAHRIEPLSVTRIDAGTNWTAGPINHRP